MTPIISREKPTDVVIIDKKVMIRYKHFIALRGNIIITKSNFTGTTLNNSLFNLN